MFSHHHVARERLSVRERMSNILTSLERTSFLEFVHLFRPEEGRMGVTVTFIAILELMREGLVEIVQAEPYAPIHLRSSAEKRNLRLVANNETPEQVEHAKTVGETVLEEVVAERAEAEARSLADDVGFVDDDTDPAEEEIEDFGLDEIKVPTVNFGKPDPGWRPSREPGDVLDELGLPVDIEEPVDTAAGVVAEAVEAGAPSAAQDEQDEEGVDDAGIVDSDATDEDKSPPDEGRS
jgi:hypothetical protein